MRPLLILSGLLALTVGGYGQDEPSKTPSRIEMTPEAESAIEKGLNWLSKVQKGNGSYGNGQAPVATTALVGLAFLAGGNIPGRTRYGDNVKDCIRYLMNLSSSKKTGYINEGGGKRRGQGGSGMHGHGYAMLFLAQAYGMSDHFTPTESEELKDLLTRAAIVSTESQSADGGWNYEPKQQTDEGSVTITQVQGLRAARNSGIHVNLNTIERAIGYVNKVTDANGRTRYSLRGGGGGQRPTLTAAAMCSLTYLGQYDNPKIKKGLDFLLKGYKPGTGANVPRSGAWGQWWFFYGNYYGTIAMYQAGGKYWDTWWPAVRQALIKAQGSNGSWTGGESRNYGPEFGSALALVTLQVPFRYLPIFQRAED